MSNSDRITLYVIIVIVVVLAVWGALMTLGPLPDDPHGPGGCMYPVYPPEEVKLGKARCDATATAAAQPPEWWQFWRTRPTPHPTPHP